MLSVAARAWKNYEKHYRSDQTVQASRRPQERRMHATGRSKYRKQYSDTNVVKAKSGPRGESSLLFRRFPGSDTDRQQPDTQYPSDSDPDRIQTFAQQQTDRQSVVLG